MDYFKDWPMTLIITGLVFICLIGFGVGIGGNYGKSSSTMTTNYINITPLQNQLNKTSTDAANWEKIFTSDSLFVVAGGIILYSIWTITTLLWTTVSTFFTIYFSIINNFLGIPPLVTGILTAVVVLSMIFLGWRLIKQGQ